MKKLTAIMLVILVLTGWYLKREETGPVAEDLSDIQLLSAAFAATGAVADAAEISAWAVVAPSHYTPRQAEAAVETMAEAFELNRLEYNVQLRSTGHYGYALLDYELSDTVHLRIQVQSLDTETIACIEIRQTVHRGLETMHRQTLQAFAALGIAAEEVKITSCLEGHVNARLRDSDKLNLVYSAFNAVDAAYQEGVNANGVAVWSGWSPRFAQSVHTGIGEVNFGVALRRQKDSNRTVVRIATPVLPGSF
ncbi:MAG: hypothetical protein GX090_04095 [Firmicutes bacterium]|nr:hypothetical protein [Bacillota bacterium]HOB35331.1 YwmB family TATA-box binding protein [Bacillota bacterium]HPZ90168.1 YwmB family TATA-box binding protein [Bacillota bacterium]HQE01558.1 YwmB family TATA-box binding protein [Bacillota bacterium]